MTHRAIGSVGVAVGLAALFAMGPAGEARGQGRVPSGKAATPKAVARPKAMPKDPTGADVLTLRDGKTLLGQVYDPSPRGTYLVIVRRAWAEANLPEWYGRWTKAEGNGATRALMIRRDRLAVWRRDRLVVADPADRLNAWLDRQLAKGEGDAAASPLMVVKLSRSDVKNIDRRGMTAARALRLGWLAGFKDVETMPLADLKDALESRGLTVEGEEAIALDPLLPPSAEPDAQWLVRRAATEVLNDDSLKFIRFGGTVIQEPAPGQRPDPAAAASILSGTLKDLLGEPQADPLTASLRSVAARGRSGAIVTRLDMAQDFNSVTVEVSLFFRQPDGTWARGPWRSATVHPGDVARGAADAIADDPQVKSVFGMFDSIGLGQGSDDLKRKALSIGAMSQRASGLAKSAFNRDLSALAVPLENDEPAPAKPKDATGPKDATPPKP